MLFQIINKASSQRMAEADTLDNAIPKARELADKYKQIYSIFNMIHCMDIEPTPPEPDAATETPAVQS